MVLLPAGEFVMGSDQGRTDERPERSVYLDAFYIDKYEVTNSQYQAFVKATNRGQPAHAGEESFNGPNQPVVGVTWKDSKDYCAWVEARLPTEAEWEKAARGTDARIYPWGNSDLDGKNANFADINADLEWRDISIDDGYPFTAPVGSYEENRSPFGAYDMVGNVWEWVSDWYAGNYYSKGPTRNPQGPETGSDRVVRGGS